jgi:hypothetical protein
VSFAITLCVASLSTQSGTFGYTLVVSYAEIYLRYSGNVSSLKYTLMEDCPL